MSEEPMLSGKKPGNVDLDTINRPMSMGEMTKVTLEYEAPDSRRAREAKETAQARHEHLVVLLKLGFAGILILGFFTLGTYLIAFKPDATEAQRALAVNVFTALLSGSAGYAFGKKEGKSDKE